MQADKKRGNKARRVHLTLELPWSADRTIQQFGRSHRSNQRSAPIYKMLMTPAAGEFRFAASAAKRLQSLGASLKGNRDALGAAQTLKEFDIIHEHGKKALMQFVDELTDKKPLMVADERARPLQPIAQIPHVRHTRCDASIIKHACSALSGHVCTRGALMAVCLMSDTLPTRECTTRCTGSGTFAPRLCHIKLAHLQVPSHLSCADALGKHFQHHSDDTRRFLNFARTCCVLVGILDKERLEPDAKNAKHIRNDVPKFLNRLLGLNFQQQNIIFQCASIASSNLVSVACRCVRESRYCMHCESAMLLKKMAWHQSHKQTVWWIFRAPLSWLTIVAWQSMLHVYVSAAADQCFKDVAGTSSSWWTARSRLRAPRASSAAACNFSKTGRRCRAHSLCGGSRTPQLRRPRAWMRSV